MSGGLSHVPSDRVVVLPDAQTDALAMSIASDQAELAAVVHRPIGRHALPADFVHAAVDRLEQVAVELLPAWLPEATEEVRPDTAGLDAIRIAATARARRDRYPGSFLPDLAVFAVTARRRATTTTLPLRIRVAALARLVAAAFGRRKVVLLVEPTGADGAVVAAGASWLVHHGGPAVWLTGVDPTKLEGIPAFRIDVPRPSPAPTAGSEVVGKPHPASAVEKRLEAALAAESWAAGRRWNHHHQPHPLATPVRLDLLWPVERCVVEIDGPEHCRPDRFEADRQRDVQLQLDGYAVLRFTNARVIHDVGAVVQQIGECLRNRRRDIAEGRHHGWR